MTIVSHFPPYVPATLKEHYFSDVPAPTAGDDNKALTYNHGLAGYVYTSFEEAGAVDAHVALPNPHTQYLLATGYTADDVLAKLLTVDDNASGLNAMTLQGLSPSAFDATGLAAAAASSAATALATHAGTASGVHGIASFGATLNATVDRAAAQTALALVPGANVQAQNANLAAIAGLTTAANKIGYWTGSGAAALADFTSYGRGLVASADAPTARTTLALGTMATETAADYPRRTGVDTMATSQAQAFTNGVIGSSYRPPSDSTTAIKFRNAANSSDTLVLDTTNNSVEPSTSLQIRTDGTAFNTASLLYIRQQNAVNSAKYSIQAVSRISGASNAMTVTQVSVLGSIQTVAGANTITMMRGVVGEAVSTTAATVTIMEAVTASALVTNGTIGTLRSFSLTGGIFGGSVGTYQALFIDDIAGATYNYAIYSIGNLQSVHKGPMSFGSLANPTAQLDISASTTARASLRIRNGVRPTVTAGNPNDGEIWYDGTHVYMRIAGADKQLDN